MSTLLQLLGLVLALLGLYLLVGVAWTLLAAGLVLLVVATLIEFTAPREGWKDGT